MSRYKTPVVSGVNRPARQIVPRRIAEDHYATIVRALPDASRHKGFYKALASRIGTTKADVRALARQIREAQG